MSNTQTLRIIAGQWRGRKFRFPDVPQLRPTPDRVRETLFNWLMPVIEGARCLDLFAGSGALGLEALSRGASEVVFCDSNKKVISYLDDTLATLAVSQVKVHTIGAMQYLNGESSAFDIIFLDPPYNMDVLAECCEKLEQSSWLKQNALVYLEHSGHFDTNSLPENWIVTREKQASQVYYLLIKRQ